MSNLKFQLNANKHPKDCPSNSLVYAHNVRVSDDFSCLQNEESIVGHPTINAYIEEYAYNIINVIPCNKELVIFVTNPEYPDEANILRYNEDDDIIVHMYSNLEYSGGKIIGTFTYNINSELIIAFSEYGGTKDVPLKTINLGVWNGENTTSEELNFSDGKLALNPEVKIPSISYFDYVSGNSYKGWYYYFIRYKINKNDYTRWFPIGFPIFITALELRNIFKYGLNGGTATGTGSERVIDNNFYLNGISDHFSSKEDVTDETIYLDLENIDTNYNYFQIGFICVSKTYSKAFRTSDISVSSEYTYTMNISNCIEYSVNSLIIENYNYYNVRNIINYKNRLYISNYKEVKDPDISEENLKKIRLKLAKQSYNFYDIKRTEIISEKEKNIDINSISSNEYIDANPILKDINLTISYAEVTALSVPFDFTTVYIETNLGTKYYPTVEETTESTGRGTKHIFTLSFTINGYIYKTKLTAIYDTTNTSVAFYVTYASEFTNIIYISDIFNYINTDNSFNLRKRISTLIPGEVYNFYIHFVNKYGESTKGYKLHNTAKCIIEGNDTEYIPIKINDTDTDILLVPKDNNIFGQNVYPVQISLSGIKLGRYLNYDNSTDSYIFEELIYENTRTRILSIIAHLNIRNLYSIDNSLKWYELYSYYIDNNNANIPFSYYKNLNNDVLFKVPNYNHALENNGFKVNCYSLNFDLNGFQLPDGYIGYYFSYEKFESIKKVTGILSKMDIFQQLSIFDGDVPKYKRYNEIEDTALQNVKFYSSDLDINDEPNLDYNCIRVEPTHSILLDDESYLYTSKNKDILLYKYPINYNKVEAPIKNEDTNFHFYSISNIQLDSANKVIDNKFGVGTSLTIKTEDLNKIFSDADYIRVSLLKLNKNIYTNENKILIKFTDIYYDDTGDTIFKGLNGRITYQGTLIYNYNKFIMSAENVILTEQFKTYYRCPVYEGLYERFIGQDRPPIAYIQQLCYNDTFYEAKSFKTEPEVLFQNIELVTDKENDIIPFAINNIVTPANSVDLFEELQTNQDKLNPKTYLANNDNKTYLTQFDKRVRRSNVIADESLNNSWRTFPLEGYKDISENKGNITNLIGIGTTLLVHTEHSLFAFDGSNTLKTGDDQNIRLTLPDIFDIDYTEVFTSDLGVCGLQDKEAWTVGQFGYIFYDNDAHRFYKFASKKIEVIDYDIVQLLNNSIPYEVRFASDIERNRLLIKFKIYDGVYEEESRYITYTMSYNHQLNKFISWHTYNFDKSANTKNILYLMYNNKIYCNIHDLNWSDYKVQRRRFASAINENYGIYENGINTSPKLSIIVNDSYNIIKTIEFISYKLFKKSNSSADSPIVSDIIDERELSRVPYSGYQIRIHNDMCDSGLIDVSVDTNSAKNVFNNYKKPWWEFGNWNFNYFRDTKQGVSSHDIMSRLYGNYFIIDFIFYDDNNPYNQKIEFENLDVKLIADETV